VNAAWNSITAIDENEAADTAPLSGTTMSLAAEERAADESARAAKKKALRFRLKAPAQLRYRLAGAYRLFTGTNPS